MKTKFGVIVALAFLTGIASSGIVQASFSGTFEVDVPVIEYSEKYISVKEYRPTKQCSEVQVREGGGDTSSHTPELLGAIVGGAIGKEIHDSKSSTTIGALLGASVASDIERKNAASKGRIRTEVRCVTVDTEVQVNRLDGYNVVYEYQGHLFRATTANRPGSTIRVKVYALPVQ